MEFKEVEFESSRLLFVRIRGETHGEEVNKVVCETFTALHPWMLWAKEKPSVQETINGLRFVTDDFRSFVFGLFEKETKKLIGTIGLHYTAHNKDCAKVQPYDVGYWLHEGYHKKGLCTESVKRVLEYGVQELGVTHFTLQCREDNFASKRVAEKCGFTLVHESGEMTEDKRPDWGAFHILYFELAMIG